MTRATYNELYHQAQLFLSVGSSVILDATFRQKRLRERAIRIAHDAHVAVLIVECHLDRTLQIVRLHERCTAKTGASDGRPELLLVHERDWEAVDSGEADLVLKVDTSMPLPRLPPFLSSRRPSPHRFPATRAAFMRLRVLANFFRNLTAQFRYTPSSSFDPGSINRI
jgi:hypothetical protein